MRLAVLVRPLLVALVCAVGAVTQAVVPVWSDDQQDLLARMKRSSAMPEPSRVVKDGVARNNCEEPEPWRLRSAGDFQPSGKGPLRLIALHCHYMWGMNYRYPHGDVLISPDARNIVFAADEIMQGQRFLHVARVDAASETTDYSADLGWSSRFLGERGRAAFEWSADSRFVWAAKMDHMRPRGGWAIGPMRLFRAEDGKAVEFPAPRHKAGPLDGVQWIGHDGKALAMFGVRGGFQKPKRTDRNPTMAMIDAKRAAVLDSYAIARFANRPNIVEGTVLPDGRLRALLMTFSKATLWTQGEPLVDLPLETRDAAAAALSPDGQSVLIQYALPVRHHCDKICEGPCKPPPKCWRDPPNAGVLAALYAVPDGRELWKLRARRQDPFDDRDPIPAISPDGAYALIGLPFSTDVRSKSTPRLALIAMRDGKIVQTMRAAGWRSALGFAQGGAIAWTHDMGFTAFYRVERPS